MALNGTLIQVPITDKNGVTSLRWVKPASLTGQSTSAIPSPVAAPQRTPEDDLLRQDHIDSAARAVGMYHSDRTVLEPFSDRVLADIRFAGRHSAQRADFLRRSIQQSEDERFIDDYVNLVHELEIRDGITPHVMTAYLRAIEDYPFIEPTVPGEPYPEKRREQCLALIEAADQLEELETTGVIPHRSSVQQRTTKGDGVNSIHLADADLALLIAQRPDDVHRILEIIAERRSTDPKIVQSVLDYSVPAVSDGIL
jgi:hypothetical protein